ncbi:hypothetical protein [Clostridium felsineum]|uniref:hypothetical protein n=1 Tax=Clostridium felsineum TaxID=36839 RepID=UPI00098C40E9|nr:hypothetical protein [Clostridium felsineum]URZ17407.1 hypothetical protein CLFE_034600 [Clostridium felsineum DSM 794]
MQVLVCHFVNQISLIDFRVILNKHPIKVFFFAGTFFGIKDDWYQMQADITFHRRDEIEALFNSYTIVEIKERQYDGECVNKNGKVINKHWHVYEVIAIKK